MSWGIILQSESYSQKLLFFLTTFRSFPAKSFYVSKEVWNASNRKLLKIVLLFLLKNGQKMDNTFEQNPAHPT